MVVAERERLGRDPRHVEVELAEPVLLPDLQWGKVGEGREGDRG